MIFQWQIALYSINRDGIQPSQYNTTTIQIVNELACFVNFRPFFCWGDFKSNCNGLVASFRSTFGNHNSMLYCGSVAHRCQ